MSILTRFADAMELTADKLRPERRVFAPALAAVSRDPEAFWKCSLELRSNTEFVCAASNVFPEGSVGEFASKLPLDFRNDPIAMGTLIDHRPSAFAGLGPRLRHSEEAAFRALFRSGSVWRLLSDEQKRRLDFLEIACQDAHFAPKADELPGNLRSDRTLLARLVRRRPKMFCELSASERDDEALATAAAIDAQAFESASERLRSDRNFFLEKIDVNWALAGVIHTVLAYDDEFVEKLVAGHPSCYPHLPPHAKARPGTALAAIDSPGSPIHFGRIEVSLRRRAHEAAGGGSKERSTDELMMALRRIAAAERAEREEKAIDAELGGRKAAGSGPTRL